ncbi:hypothetical protein TNCT_425671 [Trichonephila clavata]|uniref:DUF4817 domain-containing protein n=1 Tax=Trichonephila clavata TaxID=2740835 RepID=A0A8X6EY94_TRICU|nr:hypothetical protein TNCT_425671 [Trichonephila clavata]
MFPASLMALSLDEHALRVKLFYENKGNASSAVHEFHHRKNLRRGLMSTKGIEAMIKRFEKTGKLGVRPGSGCTRITLVLINAVKTAVEVRS